MSIFRFVMTKRAVNKSRLVAEQIDGDERKTKLVSKKLSSGFSIFVMKY